MPATIEAAAINGLYRCSSDGQTKFLEKGESLGPCSCGKGEWLFLKQDNTELNLLDFVYINTVIEYVQTDEVPEVSGKLNLFGGVMGGHRDGLYEITEARTARGPLGEKFLIRVRPVGPRQEDLPVHIIGTCGC